MKHNRNSVKELDRMFARPAYRCDPKDERQYCVYIDPSIRHTFLGFPMDSADGWLCYVDGKLCIETMYGNHLGPEDVEIVKLPLEHGELIPSILEVAKAAGFNIDILRLR